MLRQRIVLLSRKSRESVVGENRYFLQLEWTFEHDLRIRNLGVAYHVPSRYEVKEVKFIWQSGWYHGFTHHSSLLLGRVMCFFIGFVIIR